MKIDVNRSIDEYLEIDWSANSDMSISDFKAIRQLVSFYKMDGNWLDTGSGPMSVVWSHMFNANNEFVAYDIQDSLSEFYSNTRTKLKIIKYFSNNFENIKYDEALGEIKFLKWSASILNKDWINGFNNIMQVGCFGSLPNWGELQSALNNVSRYLKSEGKFFSWTWIPRSDYFESSQWGGNSLRDFSINKFLKYAAKCNLKNIVIKQDYLNDDRYCERIGFVFIKP